MACFCKNVNDKEKYIFIHIPKCGGKTMEKSFFPNQRNGTDLACYRDWEKKLDKHGHDTSSFKFFSMVRNPWDRVVSAYQRNMLPDRLKFIDRTFKEVVFAKEFPLFADGDKLKVTAMDFLKNSKGVINMDYIGRFEEFGKSFGEINKLLGKNKELIHVNPSYTFRSRPDYRDWYDKETMEFVKEYYKEDIEYFNYEF